uniref:TLDc domain-containing protein n=1 Tax=Emiliania huxleyi TaxID=2903 RepID=A0A7S3SGM6_EMIHU|mmetsp:Transcript_21845/g.65382  ORF Transcript_21845/g.65382 Transcript_21845/m.65382 type:complete len:386 (+) Transcript_21845:38-1195(+)
MGLPAAMLSLLASYALSAAPNGPLGGRGGSLSSHRSFVASSRASSRIRTSGRIIAAGENPNPFSAFLASLAPADDEYNSSPTRDARLTEQQKIAESKRAERQTANAQQQQQKAAPAPPRNPFETLVKAFTPIEVDRDGNPVEPAPQAADDRDVGERLFGLFFGEPEAGVTSGIARTSGAPDTYPATKTEFAEPVAGDDAEMALLRPLLKNTNLEYLDLKRVYDAQADGWTADAFHAGANYRGPCVVFCKTRGGAVCGGYAPKGFAGYGEYRGSIAAFLFSWPSGDTARPAIKLQKIGGAGLATIDEPETGPRFGAEGLTAMMNPGSERLVSSKLGPYYECLPDGSRSLFGAKPSSDELSELRVYAGCWPEGERIPFDGAIPFAIE